MWLHDKVFELNSASNSKLTSAKNLTLLINGKDSGLSLSKFCISFETPENANKFRASSLLEYLERDSQGLYTILDIEKKNYSINLFDPESKSTYSIKEIRNFWYQNDEVELSDKDADPMLTLIIEANNRLSENPANAGNSQDNKPAKPRAGLIPAFSSPSYEKDKNTLIDKGYKEITFNDSYFKNFRILHNPNFKDIKVVEILENEDYNIIPRNSENIFTDNSGEEKILIVSNGTAKIDSINVSA